ncbi:MAG TPA: LemA family protein [Bryobacteraceae bacterium]|jgi:LemA protein|nr:LemA family protein [Bryobacteraceae bacterium]
MKAALITLGVIVVIILIFGMSLVGTRNSLVAEKQAVDAQWSQVDVALQRRADLIPNLVETVKGFAKQEQAVFGQIAQARSALLSARTPQEKIDANAQLSSALGRLLVIVENYPQLRSSEHFHTLMIELEGTENRINVERRKYNEAVQRYNTDIQLFPKNLAASLFGFGPAPYFKAEEAAKIAPKVQF